MGAAMPRGVVVRDLVGRIQPLKVALLLPLFFTYSGLNTKIGLLNTSFLWAVCGAVLIAAILGKGVACWLAARATGIPSREALGIGTLMNARGLMELIVINIGLQRGIISEGLFATLVIMAVPHHSWPRRSSNGLWEAGRTRNPEPEAEEKREPKFVR
jgi:Kef-type K+ transport system membrane component KefB